GLQHIPDFLTCSGAVTPVGKAGGDEACAAAYRQDGKSWPGSRKSSAGEQRDRRPAQLAHGGVDRQAYRPFQQRGLLALRDSELRNRVLLSGSDLAQDAAGDV